MIESLFENVKENKKKTFSKSLFQNKLSSLKLNNSQVTVFSNEQLKDFEIEFLQYLKKNFNYDFSKSKLFLKFR